MPALSLNASQKTKHTPAGEIPVDWACVKLEDTLLKIESGFSLNAQLHPAPKGTPAILKLNAVKDGQFFPERNKQIPPSELEKAITCPRANSIIITRSNTPNLVGAVGLVKESRTDRYLPDTMWQLIFKEDQIEVAWVNAVLSSTPFQVKFERLASGTSANMKKLQKGIIKQLPIPLPPLPEQKKIAKILSAWDRAIESQQALIAAKTERKNGLSQQLLTGKKRLPGFKEKWSKKTFGDFLSESRLQGSDGSIARKITIKLYGRGVFEKKETRIGSTNTKYYTRKAGQFIYSKLDFLNGAFAIIPKHLDGLESTLDLPAFNVSKEADARWLLAYIGRPHFYTTQAGSAAGGRKARRVNPSEFLALKLNIPEITEQKAIADCLDAANKELALLTEQLETLREQKRGLMQRLLTGTVRVKI